VAAALAPVYPLLLPSSEGAGAGRTAYAQAFRRGATAKPTVERRERPGGLGGGESGRGGARPEIGTAKRHSNRSDQPQRNKNKEVQ
jgi:hypothetical protein